MKVSVTQQPPRSGLVQLVIKPNYFDLILLRYFGILFFKVLIYNGFSRSDVALCGTAFYKNAESGVLKSIMPKLLEQVSDLMRVRHYSIPSSIDKPLGI